VPPDEQLLDNAVWHALNGPHAAFAQAAGQARRYATEVSVFYAIPDDQPESWDDAARLSDDGTIVIFRPGPIRPPDGWRMLFGGEGHQMVLRQPPVAPTVPTVDATTGRAVTMRPLEPSDVPDMVALVALTEPGPFRPGTIRLGGYTGIFHDDELVAMAGQRLHPPGLCEVSAVCTHPDVRRRGYASMLTSAVAAVIADRGETPFLHVAHGNDSAKAVYEKLGFATRGDASFGLYRAP
jgi:GNAT superfamily N-acetyltransferase